MADAPIIAPKEITCDDCRALLSDYIDRELTGSEKMSVEQHLGSCGRCGTESTRMQGLKNIVQHWDGVKGSGEFRKSVMQQMIRESQQVPAAQFKEAAAAAASATETAEAEDDTGKRLPPVWILLAAIALAVIAYLVVTKLRGV